MNSEISNHSNAEMKNEFDFHKHKWYKNFYKAPQYFVEFPERATKQQSITNNM